MSWIVQNLWLIPALPLLAAAGSALLKQRHRTFAASLAIGSMVLAFFLSGAAFVQTLGERGEAARQVHNFDWFVLGETTLKLGWMLDPITAAMLVMVTFVGTLIFIYSVGYMAHDENFTRFFCFLSLFAAAMLGLVIANSLLLLFICWELVGFTSYLLIGFWYQKPSAAAAAKKAFITTRIGDVLFFLGMLWLYAETGTLLFYDGGNGCLESSALTAMVAKTTMLGMGVSTAIALLIFCGAIGKSGQVPLHVWLPDAMEGPTPVSALIHAATMVAAGVFLVARVYPLMEAMPGPSAKPAVVAIADHPLTPALSPNGEEGARGVVDGAPGKLARVSTALQAVTWIGAITAVFAALIAVGQTDIKRILAYSTVSQLGFMMMGLGTGGVAVGMFHLLTHAFFKALLFLGAGSLIHGCDEEQDIRRMGGLRRFMPVTFATYAIGMMALSGVPLFFSGFWSKDEILHGAWLWQPSKWPFTLGIFGAFLTAFYMTRQMWFVFFGTNRSAGVPARSAYEQHESFESHETRETAFPLAWGEGQGEGEQGLKPSAEPGQTHVSFPLTPALCPGEKESSRAPLRYSPPDDSSQAPPAQESRAPHESPPVMSIPLAVLAVCSILLSIFGTPVWPWFHSYLSGHGAFPDVSGVISVDTLLVMLLSAVIALGGIVLSWWFYSRHPVNKADDPDPLERLQPHVFALLRGKFFIDELYEMSVVRWNAWSARAASWLDEKVWGGMVTAVSYLVLALSWLNRLIDEFVVNLGFDQSCGGVRFFARLLSFWQNGQVQRYLRVIALALIVFALIFIWGCR